MTDTAFAFTNLPDSRAAGEFLAKELMTGLGGEPPHAILVFASSRYDAPMLLEALYFLTHAANIIGCTSAGEFAFGGSESASRVSDTGSVSALAIRSTDMRFSVGLGREIDKDANLAMGQLVSRLEGIGDHQYPFRSLLVLTDALAGQAEEMMGLLNQVSGGIYQIFGGGAGDDGKFESTQVFSGTKAYKKSLVALEICSKKPIGIGISHGWQTASRPLRVTKSEGMRLIGLNAAPAIECFKEHARGSGQELDPADPMPFFLHNILGIDTGFGIKLRVPLKVDSDGAILCAAEVPEGSTVRIMSSTAASTAEAAGNAAHTALKALAGAKPKAALFFDCVATRLRMGMDFGKELDTISEVLGDVPFVGCNTYGQIARVDGQFNGFHNCTAVVCVLPA